MHTLMPKDHPEAVAIFRSEIVGSLTRRELTRGDLRLALLALTQERFRLPGAAHTRRFGFRTLERWYYAYRARGLDGLRPEPRSDRGRAKALSPQQRTLLADIRREYPFATVPTILRTLVRDGRIAAGRRVRYHPATILRRAGPGPHPAARRARAQDAPALAGRAPRGPVARRRLLRPLAAGWRYHPPAADSRPARRCLSLRRRARSASHRAARSTCSGCWSARPASTALPTPCTSTMGPPTGATTCAPPAPAWASRCCTPARTTRRRAARWSASGARCARAASTSSVSSRPCTRSMSGCGPSSTSTTTSRLTPRCWAAPPPRSTRPPTAPPTPSTRPCFATRSPCAYAAASDVTAPCRSTVTTGRSTTASSQAASSPSLAAWSSWSDPPWIEHEGKRLLLRKVDPVRNFRRKRAPITRREPDTNVVFDPPKALLDRAVGRLTLR